MAEADTGGVDDATRGLASKCLVAISEAQYLAMAQRLRDEQVGGDILEVVRPNDGVVSRFDKRSGAFLAFDRDGTIRTFFKPNDGERYFRRQANRPPSP